MQADRWEPKSVQIGGKAELWAVGGSELLIHAACMNLDRIATYKSVSTALPRGLEVILHGYECDMEEIENDTQNLDRFT